MAGVAAAPAAARDVLSGSQEIAFLNAQRAANGIPGDVAENPAYSDACAKHMNYVALNGGDLVHQEDSTKVGYTPEGDDAAGHSVLTSAGSAFTSTGADNFETAPIHLMQMLSPWMTIAGAANGCLYTLARPNRTFDAQTTYSYPGDGSTTVPTSETAAEGPFVPGAFVGLADPARPTQGLQTGPHLMFFYAGPAASPSSDPYFDSRGHFTAASLVGPSGPVDIRTVDSDTTSGSLQLIGQYLPPGGMIIPVSPLVPNQLYTASVTFQPDTDTHDATGGGAPDGIPDLPAVSRTWSFSSGAVAPPTPVKAPPVIVGTPPPTPVKPILTHLKLKSKSVAVMSSASASLWVTVEERVRAHHKRRWKLRRSQPLPANARVVSRVALKKLGKGKYRVTIYAGTVSGKVLLTDEIRLK